MSIFNNVTAEQFKEYFFRDFPFLPIYDDTTTYFIDDVVYNTDNKTFYVSLIDDNTSPLTDTEAWATTKDNKLNYVTDEDIIKAKGQALINAKYYDTTDDENITIFLHLMAYYVCADFSNSSSGINSKYTGIMSSKSVDGVSVSYQIPNNILNNPMYSLYAQNGYGLKYLSLIAPFLACTIIFNCGRSTIG